MEIIKLENKNGSLYATSLEIARVTNKNHKEVLRDIREELQGADLRSDKYKAKNNQKYDYFILDEYETLQLMSRYSREVRKMVIDEYRRMKEHIKSQQEPETGLTLEEMTLKVITGQQQKIKELEERKEQLTNNLLTYQKYGRSVTVRDFVKIIYAEDGIKISEREMFKFLDGKYLTYNRMPYAQYKQYFEVVSVLKNKAVRNTTKISPKGILYFTNKLIKMRNEEK